MVTYDEEVDIVAILTPHEGKQERVIELLTNLTETAKQKEPDLFSYHLYRDFDRETNQEELVLVEKYANMAAYDWHAKVPEFKEMHRIFKAEQLMQKPIVIKSVKPIRGFTRPI